MDTRRYCVQMDWICKQFARIEREEIFAHYGDADLDNIDRGFNECIGGRLTLVKVELPKM